jgi:hypothetical protein
MNNKGHLVDASCNSKSPLMQAASWSATDGTPLRYDIIRSDLSSSSTNPTTTTSSSTASNKAYINKVLIPRLIREDKLAEGVKARGLQRSLRACKSCRQRKAKCTKDLPIYRACDELQVLCYYTNRKILRAKRYLHYLLFLY